MSVLALIALLVVLGIVAYVCSLIPMNATIKLVINIVLIIVAVFLVLSAFGVLEEARSIRVPKL